MNILVTGGAGFIGSNFIRYWHKKYPGDLIVNYDKLTYAGNLMNLTELENHEDYKFVKGDIMDARLLTETIEKFSIEKVIHFAAESHVDRSIDAPDDFIKTNINGTFTILEVLKRFPEIRFHHVSTDEVFGDLPLDKPKLKFKEDTNYNPRSPYSASKAASDHLVRSYINTYGLKATISNCSNNYGPYCFPEKFIPLIITRALNDEEIPVYGSGEQIRDWIHVEDHCHGIDLILNKGRIGETYLLGGNGERTNLWIAKEILQILNKPESLIVHVGDRKGHDHRYAIDYSKSKKVLGFEPQKTIEERLVETVNWYQDNQEWWKPLKTQADKIASKYLSVRL